jgi:hypothetical protein
MPPSQSGRSPAGRAAVRQSRTAHANLMRPPGPRITPSTCKTAIISEKLLVWTPANVRRTASIAEPAGQHEAESRCHHGGRASGMLIGPDAETAIWIDAVEIRHE